MTIKEFEEKIKADPELKQKFKDAKNSAMDKLKGADTIHEAMSEVAAKMGFDVPASEFKLDEIKQGALNEEELQAVAGGKKVYCDDAHTAADEGRCLADYVDTDCIFRDFCDGLVKKYEDCDGWWWQ